MMNIKRKLKTEKAHKKVKQNELHDETSTKAELKLNHNKALLSNVFEKLGSSYPFANFKHLYQEDLDNEAMWTEILTADLYIKPPLCCQGRKDLIYLEQKVWVLICSKHKAQTALCRQGEELFAPPDGGSRDFTFKMNQLLHHMYESRNYVRFTTQFDKEEGYDNLKVSIHIPRLLKYIDENNHLVGSNLFCDAKDDYNENLKEDLRLQSVKCLKNDDDLTEEAIQKVSVTPFRFKGELTPGQQTSIAWMIKTENQIGRRISILGSNQHRFSKFYLSEYEWAAPLKKYCSLAFWYDKKYKLLTMTQNNELPLHLSKKEYTSFKGGILTDAMGSGKTITVLAKCLLDDFSDNFYQSFAEKSLIEHPTLVPTLATLVVCPVGLLSEWKSRIQEFTELSVGDEVICIESKLDWKKLSYNDIMQARIVLVTEKFIDTAKPSYYCGEDYLRCFSDVHKTYSYTASEKLDKVHKHHFKITGTNTKDLSHLLAKKDVILHGFFWRRVIYDEIHRYTSSNLRNSLLTVMLNLKCQYSWGLTATPQVSSMHGIYRYIQFFQNNNDTPLNNIHDGMYFLRNHMKGFNNDIQRYLPPLKEKNIVLEMSAREKALYEYAKSNYDVAGNIARASHFSLMDSQNNEIMEQESISLQNFIDRQNRERLAQLEKLNKDLQKLCKMKYPKDDLTAVNRHESRKESVVSKIEKIKIQNAFFDKLINTFEDEESATCDICCEVQTESIAVAPCGHYCCNTCHSTLVDRSVCPHCRQNGKFVICSKNKEKEDQNGNGKPFLGTKMNAILAQIKDLLKHDNAAENRIIFFTQFASLATVMKTTLDCEGIGCVQFRGTDAHRRLVRKEWATTKPVLILTIQDSSAGLNLQEANHVILAHPLIHKGNETQAIGRAYRFGQKRTVHVSRYIMKDTVEEDLFRNNSI